MAQKFSHSEDEALVERVRDFPCIYDHADEDFKDIHIRENVWDQIGESLSKKPEDCKVRWKNIRDNYFKHKRKQRRMKKPTARPSKWHLFDQLDFLELVKSERSLLHHCDEESNELIKKSTSDEEPSHSDVSDKNSNPKKPKRNTAPGGSNTPPLGSHTSTSSRQLHTLGHDSKYLPQAMTQQKEEDDVDLFMKSVALTLKKLPPNLIPQAKLEILTVVTNLQESSASSNLTSNT